MDERPNGVLKRGHVKSIRLDGRFGFLSVSKPGGGVEDVYFNETGLAGDLMFEESLVGREVVAYVGVGSNGKTRARGVRPAW